MLKERQLLSVVKRSCFQSIVDLGKNYLQLYGTKKLISQFVQTFSSASQFWRINYWRLSDSNPQPSES